jgi:hypothetical protein
LEQVEEMDKFLGMYELPKLNQEDINNLNGSIISSVIEVIIESPDKEKSRTKWVHC